MCSSVLTLRNVGSSSKLEVGSFVAVSSPSKLFACDTFLFFCCFGFPAFAHLALHDSYVFFNFDTSVHFLVFEEVILSSPRYLLCDESGGHCTVTT